LKSESYGFLARKIVTKSPAIADDGYTRRRGNFGGSHVHSMFLMYSPDGISQEVGSLRGQGWRRRLKVVKSC